MNRQTRAFIELSGIAKDSRATRGQRLQNKARDKAKRNMRKGF